MMKIMDKKRIRTKLAILKAARILFEKHGYEDTSMEAIAAKAEIAAGTLYNYYESKPILLIAIYAEMTEQLAAKLPERNQGVLTAETALLDITGALLFATRSSMLFPKAIMRQIMAQLFVLKPQDIAELVSLDMQIVAMLQPILVEMQQKGLLDANIDIQAAAIMLFGGAMIQYQSYISIEEMTEMQLNQAVAAQVRMVFFGLLPRQI